VKVVDPSSNPYVATAAVLGLALHGLGKRFVPPGGDPD
jgi:glutamine synthetase